jgi:hypothetical protein
MMLLGDPSGQAESESSAGGQANGLPCYAIKAIEDAGMMFNGDPDARVLHCQQDVALFFSSANGNCSARGSEFEGVVQPDPEKAQE